ncbi:OmpA family protein [Aureibaculum sp. 2210JD6-5]|uniref:OmpA family protein n=1 Tax=Aureibaculum sp. 2210JD6-5 TaxID=3103957 RepID=UPI002AAEE17A|nr:OmpA family protein [Aureibaculum sp. 2210JD6-5]MDY7394686.1 OmpA family protein [Aureibaculum sp. 2210JD6-5]
MRKFILLTILCCFCVSAFAQTAESKYLIKYLETNTAQPDYGVTFLSDNQFIYKSPNTEKINTNSEKLSESNLFLATVGAEGDIIDKKQIQGLPTNKITKTGAAYSPDLKTVYFSAKKYRKKPKRKDKEQLFKAAVDDDGSWTNIEKLPFSNDKYSFGEPSLSNDGRELYFTSDMPGTLGGADIFRVAITDDGSFGEPKNLGNRINTSGNEVTPYITKDFKLYFSSNNHKDGLGNLDVYCIDLKNPIAKPVHLDAPINSANDDFAFIISKNDDRGYFSSNRLQGQNNHDIYSFLVEKVKEDGPCVQAITGVVKDNGTKQIIKDAIISLFDKDNKELEQIKTDAEGKYALTLDCNQTYTLKAEADNYNTEDHIVNTANYLEAPTLEANKFLIKKSAEEIEAEETLIAEADDVKNAEEVIEDKEEIKQIDEVEEAVTRTESAIEEDEAAISPVYFAFDRSDITAKAARELDKLTKILKNNKTIHVELSSYTDSRGSSAYNLKLSERRAKASLEYLVSQGIDRSRIKAKGYGESKMVNKCIDGIECSEAAHEKNRRTEFAFINPQAATENFDNNPVNAVSETTKVQDAQPEKNIAQTSSYSEAVETENAYDTKTEEASETENSEIGESAEVVKSTVESSKNELVQTEKLKENQTSISAKDKKQKTEEVKTEEAPKKSTLTSNKNEVATSSLIETNQPIEEEETLSEEAKWLNKEIEKSNQENNKTEVDKKEASKNQLIEPITEASQQKVSKKETVQLGQNNNSDYDNLVNTAVAEEKRESKFNFEQAKNQENNNSKETDPNKLLAELKAKSASSQTSDTNTKVKVEEKTQNNKQPAVKEEAIISTKQVSVKAMQSKRGKYIETDRSKKVNALRVTFRLQPNSNAKKGYKDAYVVIKSPSGKTVNEKGVFALANGKDQSYTDQTTVYYNNQSLKAVMFIDKIVHKFTKGVYTVNIFIDGVDVGENILTLS